MSVSFPPPRPDTEAPALWTPGPEAAPLFQSAFWGGFECSTQRRPSGRRIDVIDATGHDRFARQDYERLAAAGLRTARDGLRWHLIERTPGEYDFASALHQAEAAHAAGVQVVWDLLHYGFPDFVDPFSPEFPAVFARYAAAATRFLRGHTEGTLWLCPVNEISFTAWGGGDVGYLNPFAQGRGLTLKAQLVRAAIAAMDAAREVDPGVRFLHAEPLISVHAHPERPDEQGAAVLSQESQFEALDMLLGRLHPELGGAERYVDVVGLNYYPYNQWWHHPEPHLRQTIDHSHPAHRPLRELLAEVHARYGRPLVLAETGAEDEARAGWFEVMVQEVEAARAMGIPVEGTCLYPVVNHPGWDDDRHCHNGLWDYPDALGGRAEHAPLAGVLRKAQRARTADGARESSAARGGPASLSAVLARVARAAPAITAGAPAHDHDGGVPLASVDALRDSGLLAATVSAGNGGLGVSAARLLAVLRRLGRASVPVAQLYEGHVYALGLILAHGDSEQRVRAAQDACAGHVFGMWSSVDPAGLQLELNGVVQGWQGYGGAVLTPGAHHVTRPVLWAERPGQVGRVLALLPQDLACGRLDPARSQPPARGVRIDLTGLRVDEGNVMDGPDELRRQQEWGRRALRLLAAQLGGADAVLDAARNMLRGSGQADNDLGRLRFGASAARLEAAWQTVVRGERQLGDSLDPDSQHDRTGPALAYVALAREVAADACLSACELAERAAGGMQAPSPAEPMLKELRKCVHQSASDEASIRLGRFVLDAPELSGAAYSIWDVEDL